VTHKNLKLILNVKKITEKCKFSFSLFIKSHYCESVKQFLITTINIENLTEKENVTASLAFQYS
jgi:RNase P subunit RPR2